MKKQIFYLFLWLALPLQAQWEWQDSGTTGSLNDVYCISADTVVVVGFYSVILRTTNGGTTWNIITNPAYSTGDLYKVQFADSQTGYATGDNGTLLKTTDAGQTWQSMNTGTTESLLALSVQSVDTLYVAGTNGLLMKSVDGGNAWTPINTPENNTIYQIYFSDSGIGYILSGEIDILGVDTHINKTIDDGNTWSNLLLDNFISMKFKNDHFGVCGCYGGLVATNDGFNSDISIEYYPGNSIRAIAISNNSIWTSGQNELTCQCPNYFSKSVLDNDHYVTEYVDSGDFIANAIDFANATTGYFVDAYGRILKVTNGELPNLPSSLETYTLNPIKVYPVPAKNTITIKIDDKYKNLPFNIVDTQGRSVLPRQALKETNIDVSTLPDGVYFINFFDSDRTYTQKLIIQK